jgi:hypothetical protein
MTEPTHTAPVDAAEPLVVDESLPEAAEARVAEASLSSTPPVEAKTKKSPARKASAKKAATKKAAVKETSTKKVSTNSAKAVKQPAPKKDSARKVSKAEKPASKGKTPEASTRKKAPLQKVEPSKTGKGKVLDKPRASGRAVEAGAKEVDVAETRAKLVRDSFTMPQTDFALILALKERALGLRRPAKKGELLRAGLHALQKLSDAQLRNALDLLPKLKAGRPKKRAKAG